MEGSNNDGYHYWLGGKRKDEQDRFFEQALQASDWQRGDSNNWDACWFTGMPKAVQFQRAGPHRKINHIPGNSALTVKSRLDETLGRTRERIARHYGDDHPYTQRLAFLPEVFSMPQDYHALQQAAVDAPHRRWILKPKNGARGKGIRVIRDAGAAPMDASWMVQQYMERPHTMRGHKYVLRLYVLIAGIDPLRVYLYQQGFAKLASAPYDPNDADNPYSQLTNPDINALNLDAEVPVEFVDLERYRQWLRAQGHDDAALFQRIRDRVTLTVIAGTEAMRRRTDEAGADPWGCYELLGIDCLIDDELQPWILECNLSPSMGVCAGPESGGDVEETIKSQLVADMVHLTGLDEREAPLSASEDEPERLCSIVQQEFNRRGNFERLYPCAEAADYLPFFAMPSPGDYLLADEVAKSAVPRPRFRKHQAAEVLVDEHLGLYEHGTGRFNRLNDSAAFIWLMAMEGMTPDDMVAQILRSATANPGSTAAPEETEVRRDVWKTLAQWVERGLIAQVQDNPTPRESRDTEEPLLAAERPSASLECHLRIGTQNYWVTLDGQPVIQRLIPLLEQFRVQDDASTSGLRVDIVRDHPGYTLIINNEACRSRIGLNELPEALYRQLGTGAIHPADVLLDLETMPDERGNPMAVLQPSDQGSAGQREEPWQKPGFRTERGVRLVIAHQGAQAYPMHFPVSDADEGATKACNPQSIKTLLTAETTLNDIVDRVLPLATTHHGKPLNPAQVEAVVTWLSQTVSPQGIHHQSRATPEPVPSAEN